jgi:hypothetical protein
MIDKLLEKLLELQQDNNDEKVRTLLNVLIYLKMNEEKAEKYTDDTYFINIEDNQYFEIRNYSVNMIFYEKEKITDRFPLFRHNPNQINETNNDFILISNYYKEIVDNIIILNKNKDCIKKSILTIEKMSPLDDIIINFTYGTTVEYHFLDQFDFESYLEEHHKDIISITINDEIISRTEYLTDKFQKTEYDESIESESYEFLKYLKDHKMNKYI